MPRSLEGLTTLVRRWRKLAIRKKDGYEMQFGRRRVVMPAVPQRWPSCGRQVRDGSACTTPVCRCRSRPGLRPDIILN